MPKGVKLMNLKSLLKKLNSFTTNHSRHNISAVADDESSSSTSDLHPVYVGKSRRLYRVTSDVVDHPLFRELVERSRDEEEHEDDNNYMNVACEVVLFEHLIWMLQNVDEHQMESLHELVDFYAC